MASSNPLKTIAAALCLVAAPAIVNTAHADETILIGMSFPLSGANATWGLGSEWMCKKAAEEVKAAGGVTVKGTVYNFQCLAYDHHYTAADGTKVAQTLLNKDGAKILSVMGTAPVAASQSLTEHQGALLFMQAWGKSTKGPQFPMSFNIVPTPFEIVPGIVKYVTGQNPQAKTMVMLNPNDATGRETAGIATTLWQKAGVKVLTSDFYERGTTEFQPIAERLMSFKPDIVDLGTVAQGEAGIIFKAMQLLGYKGVQILDNGSGVDAISGTGGGAANGTIMGGALVWDGPSIDAHQRAVGEAVHDKFGEYPAISMIGAYDPVYALKAAIEKAQSIDPKAIAAAIPTTTFKSFYGGDVRWGGKDIYGADQQPQFPVTVSQIVDGKLVERARVVPQ
jgi:branched-chain amino acid transport system substrate-binding protein